MPEVVYLNGEYTDSVNAKISVNDRGFVFGDGVYEVIRVYPKNGPFAMQQHIDRLFRSLEGTEIRVPWTKQDIIDIGLEALRRSGFDDASIYIEITRGVAPRAHVYPADVQPTLLVYAKPAQNHPEQREKGITCITVPDIRWAHCDWKTINLLANVMGRQKAHDAGAWEGIFVNGDGMVTEGTATNVFAITGGVVLTHPADNRILHGVTRATIIDLCRLNGVRIQEERFTEDVLLTADEVFVCGTSSEILPVTKINEKIIGNGKPGTVTRQIAAAYNALIR